MDTFKTLHGSNPKVQSEETTNLPELKGLNYIAKQNIIYEFAYGLAKAMGNNNSRMKKLELRSLISESLQENVTVPQGRNNVANEELLYKSLALISKKENLLKELSNSIYEYFCISTTNRNKFRFKDINKNFVKNLSREGKSDFFKRNLTSLECIGNKFNKIVKKNKEEIEKENLFLYSRMDVLNHTERFLRAKNESRYLPCFS